MYEAVVSPIGPPTVVPVRNPSFLPNWKRRRLKQRSNFSVSVSLEGLFHGITSVFPVVVVPALGLLSVTTRRRREDDLEEDVAGSWIMFSSPTAFNRSVWLRCPSLLFEEGGRMLDGVNNRLVEEERHFVHLDSGRIPVSGKKDGSCDDSVVAYQRVCVRTDDGGVIALDWPDNLDLKEHGLDTTVLLVPGTTKGSLDRDVRSFLCQTLRYGCFPVVMNPRGCAGSPVISPRLFTAADSGDIATAIRFIKRTRPWTTLMCVGWGYGSNMLTKYLGESGEETSVTAAVCLDNPFDLDEATRSYPHCDALDQKLAHGLVDVLQTNKEIFQGKNKGFDVARALSATTVRDFEEAISMISYGFADIKEFYSMCSTQNSVRSVRVPLLFIQSDERIAPILAIPHNSIMKNPFSSLLMCSCLPSNVFKSGRSSTVWCQHLAIEWLQAVELALLSGRHPLLEGVNIPLNISCNFPLLNNSESEKTLSSTSKIKGKYLFTSQNSQTEIHTVKLPQSNEVSYMFEERNYTEPEIASGCETSPTKQLNTNSVFGNESFVDVEKDVPSDNENSQALVTAAVIFKMLDARSVRLDSNQKRMVLTSVEHGESLMKALQGVVSKTVYEQLVNTIYDVLQTQSTKPDLDGLRKCGCNPDINSHTQEKVEETPRLEVDDLRDQRNYVIDDKMHGVSAQVHWFRNSAVGNGATSQDIITHNSEVVKPCLEMEHNQMETNRSEEVHAVKDHLFEYNAVAQNHTVHQPHDGDQMISLSLEKVKEKEKDNDWEMLEANQNRSVDGNEGGNEKILKNDSHDGGTMVGDLTSVMCSSSVLSCHHNDKFQDSYERIISISNNTDNPKMPEKLKAGIQDTNHGKLMSTITEKAMSVVASPIVPTHNDGRLDHDRLVTMLMELGQKGGLFRVFCNIALLWGGIRSATNLTDRLIGYLRIAERPLFQRILGFACMVLMIWSPIAIPLLPNIVLSWETKISYGIIGYACLAGLHAAVLILIILWGKRIRGYNHPLKQYGLSFPSISKIHGFFRGLIGGATLVIAVHLVNASLGYAFFVKPPNLPRFSAGATILVKEYGRLALLFIRGTLIAFCVAVMEELLFRSWLLDEISVDYGYNLAVIISGLSFSLFQRSLSSIPGFLFLSLALSGVKQRDHGSLYIPIGVRSGTMLTSFLIQILGFITYRSSTPFWLVGTHFRHPFDGAVGLSFCIMLAIFLYPREQLDCQKAQENIQNQMGDA